MTDSLQSIDPLSGERVATYDVDDHDSVVAAVERADAAHREWRRTDHGDRADLLQAVAEVLERRSDEFAHLMAREMGKPITDGRGEIAKCAWVCRYYAENGAAHLADIGIETDSSKSYIHYEPLGVVLAVMPWNFPFWQVLRFAAPMVTAGNAGLLKHASNVTGCARAIEEVFVEAGAPHGLFATLVVPSSRVDSIIGHRLVRAVTLTGSEPAGRAVAASAGAALKKTVLELGGSDPYLVLADADLDHAAAECARSRLVNGGQSCIAAKRFVVAHEIHDEFVDRLAREMETPTVGDPRDDDTDIGPMARIDIRDDVHDQVERTIAEGARSVLGAAVPDGPGAFYPPTVLVDVEPGMAAADEEVFGPVAAVLRADDLDDAIRIANATSYGLGAAVFTSDLELGEDVAARRLEAGSCFVNTMVASDPRLPFGGIKNSGYGRELSPLGVREFVNAKTVLVE